MSKSMFSLSIKEIDSKNIKMIPHSNESHAKSDTRKLLNEIIFSEGKAAFLLTDWMPGKSYNSNEKKFMSIVETLGPALLGFFETGIKHKRNLIVYYLAASTDNKSFDICSIDYQCHKNATPTIGKKVTGISISFHFIQRLIQRYSSDKNTLLNAVRYISFQILPALLCHASIKNKDDIDILIRNAEGATVVCHNKNEDGVYHAVTFLDEDKYWNNQQIKNIPIGITIRCIDEYFKEYKKRIDAYGDYLFQASPMLIHASNDSDCGFKKNQNRIH
jgi:hypothetical protein